MSCSYSLPEGWEQRTNNGRVYYVSHAYKTSQWERPTRPASEVAALNSASTQIPNSPIVLTTHSLNGNNSAVIATPQSNNSINNQPAQQASSSSSSGAKSTRTPSSLNPRFNSEGLPEGYEILTTDQGQIYFLHRPTCTIEFINYLKFY